MLITEMPDNTAAAASCIAAFGSGALKTLKTTPLISVAESMQAMKKAGGAGFRPPG